MAEYRSIKEYKQELGTSVNPYRNLLRHELRQADFNEPYYRQEFTSSYDYAQEYRCDHVCRQPVRWILSNGVERVTLQCVACGDKESSGVRKADYPNFDELPEIDEWLIEDSREAWRRFTEDLHNIYLEICNDFERQKEELSELARMSKNAEWWAKYNRYLRSEKWQDKRQRVLERDGYVCQACLKREANQAHHLTYDHVFDEPLFDLISVCTTCHKKLHPHMQEARHAQAA